MKENILPLKVANSFYTTPKLSKGVQRRCIDQSGQYPDGSAHNKPDIWPRQWVGNDGLATRFCAGRKPLVPGFVLNESIMKKHLLSPSLLAADFTRLREEIQVINDSEADWLHLDVMDGRFVPNITFGMGIVEAVNQLCAKPLDVHLMIVEPERYVEAFCAAGADIVSVHYEACPHLHRVLQQIKACGAKAGIAVNPHTSVELLVDVLCEADLVCVMSVNPGFGGQQFIYQTLAKIRRLRRMVEEQCLPVQIEVDGGVGLHNAGALLQAGADVLVAGSSVFGAPDPRLVIREIKAIGSEPSKY
ncbi:MAG: ribulose-phosphate 3-epimerase [Bacteroidota bacterium]